MLSDQTIRLTRTHETDLAHIVAAERHPDNAPYLTPWTETEHRATIANPDALHLVIRDDAARGFLGFVFLLGLAKPDRAVELKRLVVVDKGKGTGRRALRLLLQYVFHELGAHRFWLDVKDANARAIAFYRSQGFQVEGTLRDCFYRDGRHESLVLMAVLAHEYEAQQRTPVRARARPDCIKHYTEIQGADDAHYPDSDELLTIGSPFGERFGLKRIGLHHEVVPPGRRTCWPHAESTEEEFVYVIEGYPQVWLDGEVYDLVPGDAVGFPPGTGMAHVFLNNSAQDVRLIVVGERSRPDNRVHYPLHPRRNAEIGARHWVDVPKRLLGPHDGKPDAWRAAKGRSTS